MEESSNPEHASSAIGPKDLLHDKKENWKYTSSRLKRKELGKLNVYDEQTSKLDKYIFIFVDTEEFLQEQPSTSEHNDQLKDNNYNWKYYTPTNLKQKKHKKLSVYNKPSPKVAEKNTLYELKRKYFEQKIKNLLNDDHRKQEKHEQEMKLMDLQIRQSSFT